MFSQAKDMLNYLFVGITTVGFKSFITGQLGRILNYLLVSDSQLLVESFEDGQQ